MTNYKREEHIFNATIVKGDFVLENVFCRVYLPIKVADPIEVIFYPNKEQTKIIVKTGKDLGIFSFSGEIRDYYNELQFTINSETTISRGLKTKTGSYDVQEAILTGNAIDLRITHHLKHSSKQNFLEGSFFISPNHLLRSSFIDSRSRLGEINFESVRNFKFRINEDTELVFEDVYRHCKNENEEEVIFLETIASFILNNEKNDSSKFTETWESLEDLLVLASFAARQRCNCFGWRGYDFNSSVTQYLRNKSKPSEAILKRKFRYGDEVIDIAEFQEFINVAYECYRNFSDVDVLRRIINFTIPDEKDTIESGFATLYAALEMLISYHRKSNDLEFIFSGSEFKKIRKSIKTHIDGFDLEDDVKKMMQDKLSELNRVSFNTAFEHFCTHYKVELQDLWSVTDNNNGITLAQIRNKLMHGEHFNSEETFAITYAKDHLQWIVERMILAVLNWDISRSEISSHRLSGFYSYQDWTKYRDILSKK